MRACFGAFLKPFRFGLAGLLAIGAACSGDDVDGLFENGGAAASSVGAGESSANAGNTVAQTVNAATNTVAQTVDAAQSSTDAGEATASTQDGTSASDAASSSGDQGSASSGVVDTKLPCGQIQCGLSLNEVCCLFDPIDTTECKTQCNGVEIALECDGPSACNGHQCCARRGQFAGNYERLVCNDDPCDEGQSRVVCDSAADCAPDQICEQSDLLPSGYKVCKDD